MMPTHFSRWTRQRATEVYHEHRLVFWLVLLLVLARAPLLFHIPEYVLRGQDVNPIHLADLFFHGRFAAIDDSDVGENSRTLGLSSAYFLIPLALRFLGIPDGFFLGLHQLFALPALIVSLYALSYALFAEPRLALFTSLLFPCASFALFSLNVGYPLLLHRQIYYGDVNQVPAILVLAALLRERAVLAGLSSLVLSTLNPTYGANGAVLFFAVFLRSRRGDQTRRHQLLGPGLVLGGLVLAFLMVMAATPIHSPAPQVARDIAIRSYGHAAIHAGDPMRYVLTTIALGLALAFIVVFEVQARRRWFVAGHPSARRLAQASLGVFLAYGVGLYWLTYVLSPSLFMALAPAKFLMILAFYVAAYVGFGLFLLLMERPLLALAVGGVAALGILHPALVRGMLPYLTGGGAVLGAGALVYAVLRETRAPASRFGTLLGLATAAALGIYTALHVNRYSPSLSLPIVFAALGPLGVCAYSALGGDSSAPRGQRRLGRLALFVAIGLLIADLARSVASHYPVAPPYRVAAAFYDIQEKIRKSAPDGAIFIPYRLSGAEPNDYGPFENWPIRTYSRRGALAFWRLGVNAYFNSRERHHHEERAYKAGGIELWEAIEREDQAARRVLGFSYYTGIQIDWNPCCRVRYGVAAPLELTAGKYQRLMRAINAMSFAEFKDYGRRVGATHLIVSWKPGLRVAGETVVLQNDYFGVIPLR